MRSYLLVFVAVLITGCEKTAVDADAEATDTEMAAAAEPEPAPVEAPEPQAEESGFITGRVTTRKIPSTEKKISCPLNAAESEELLSILPLIMASKLSG